MPYSGRFPKTKEKPYHYSVTGELLDFTEKINIDFYAYGQMWSLTEHSEDGKPTFTSNIQELYLKGTCWHSPSCLLYRS